MVSPLDFQVAIQADREYRRRAEFGDPFSVRSQYRFDTLDLPTMEALLKTFEYKPNWSFTIEPNLYDNTDPGRLRVNIRVPDSTHPEHRAVLITSARIIPPCHGVEDFWRFLRAAVHDIEAHEADEWFKVGGKVMFDPHK